MLLQTCYKREFAILRFHPLLKPAHLNFKGRIFYCVGVALLKSGNVDRPKINVTAFFIIIFIMGQFFIIGVTFQIFLCSRANQILSCMAVLS